MQLQRRPVGRGGTRRIGSKLLRLMRQFCIQNPSLETRDLHTLLTPPTTVGKDGSVPGVQVSAVANSSFLAARKYPHEWAASTVCVASIDTRESQGNKLRSGNVRGDAGKLSPATMSRQSVKHNVVERLPCSRGSSRAAVQPCFRFSFPVPRISFAEG